MDVVRDIVNEDYFYTIYISIGIFAILFGILMLYLIKKDGKIVLISWLLKNKDFNNDILVSRYSIQAVYTSLFGVALLILAITEALSGFNILIFIMIIALLDGTYDFFAIKKAKI